MYRYFHGSERNTIPNGLPSRLVDPMLRTIGDNPQFLKIGEGNEPRNELLRIVKQYPSKDEVRTKVLGDIYPPTDDNPYLRRPDNIAAIKSASQELGIPLEKTGLRIATSPFRLEGDVADVNLLAQVTNKAAGNLKRSGKPTFGNALTRKADFFNQPRSYRELAVDGTEGIEAILEAYEKAEPRRTASSQGNRPILMQADGLDPNIGIPTGSPENIPPMDIEGMKGANRYVDVSQGLETARVIQYPNIYDRLNNGAQPTVTATIPYSADIPTAIGDSILSPKVSIETKRPRFIDEGTGIYTRQGELINAEQKNLLDTGMADLEDRSFILRDPSEVNRQYTTQKQYYLDRTRDVPVPVNEQYRPTTRLGLQTLGLNADIGRQTVTPSVEIGDTLYPSNSTIVRRSTPINRLTDDLSDRVLSGDVDLRNYELFKSNANTYGARDTKVPWREYYSDPFVYEDKGLDGEVSRLVQAVNEAPAQLENAYTQQTLANRRALDIQDTINTVRRMGRGTTTPQSDVSNMSVDPELIVKPTSLFKSLKNDRRMAEIDAAKASDTIAQLKAAQELMGVEYMVKPKSFSPDVLKGYRIASRDKGGIKNSYIQDYPSGSVLDPIDYENAMIDMGYTGSRSEPDRDYDIASLFGFTGNY